MHTRRPTETARMAPRRDLSDRAAPDETLL